MARYTTKGEAFFRAVIIHETGIKEMYGPYSKLGTAKAQLSRIKILEKYCQSLC